jgi:hypothetical protein
MCFGLECTISRHQSCEASIQLHLTKIDIWECYGALRWPCACKNMKTCVSGLNALIRSTKVEKHPFSSIGPKMIYRNDTAHFANLLHVKRCTVSGLNALFWGTEVAKILSQQKHPFYSIRPQMMFESVSEHFHNLLHVKKCKTCVSGLIALFGLGAPKLQSIRSTPLDPK